MNFTGVSELEVCSETSAEGCPTAELAETHGLSTPAVGWDEPYDDRRDVATCRAGQPIFWEVLRHSPMQIR